MFSCTASSVHAQVPRCTAPCYEESDLAKSAKAAFNQFMTVCRALLTCRVALVLTISRR